MMSISSHAAVIRQLRPLSRPVFYPEDPVLRDGGIQRQVRSVPGPFLLFPSFSLPSFPSVPYSLVPRSSVKLPDLVARRQVWRKGSAARDGRTYEGLSIRPDHGDTVSEDRGEGKQGKSEILLEATLFCWGFF